MSKLDIKTNATKLSIKTKKQFHCMKDHESKFNLQ